MYVKIWVRSLGIREGKSEGDFWFIKNIFLDVFSSVSGFIYGFVVTGLVILFGGGIIYLLLLLRNLIF